jgi:hypothetical protein
MKLTAEEKEEVRETYLKILEILHSKDEKISHKVILRLYHDIFTTGLKL